MVMEMAVPLPPGLVSVSLVQVAAVTRDSRTHLHLTAAQAVRLRGGVPRQGVLVSALPPPLQVRRRSMELRRSTRPTRSLLLVRQAQAALQHLIPATRSVCLSSLAVSMVNNTQCFAFSHNLRAWSKQHKLRQ